MITEKDLEISHAHLKRALDKAIAYQIDRCADCYVRARDLPNILPGLRVNTRAGIIKTLEKALLAEQRRVGRGHWSAAGDDRLIALSGALKAERRGSGG